MYKFKFPTTKQHKQTQNYGPHSIGHFCFFIMFVVCSEPVAIALIGCSR